MSERQLLYDYIDNKYVNIPYPIITIKYYYITGGYRVHFVGIANDCIYIETGKRFRFSIDMQIVNGEIKESQLLCTDLDPNELQEITNSLSSSIL